MFLNNTHTFLLSQILVLSNTLTLLATVALKSLTEALRVAHVRLQAILGRTWAPSWPQNNPLGLLLAILSIILAQEWSPWGSSWLSWAPSWRKNGPLGAPLHHLGPKMVPLGLLLAILGTILAQNGSLGGPLGDLGHNLERHSLYSQTPDQPQSGRYLYISLFENADFEEF